FKTQLCMYVMIRPSHFLTLFPYTTLFRSLVAIDSPYDRFVMGDKKALSEEAQRGLLLIEETGCFACHSGPHFSGPSLPPGRGFYQKFPLFPGTQYEHDYQLTKDPGRFEVTRKVEDKNMWRVPTLRNIALTAPYFHNGSVSRLDEAVRVM